MKGFLKVGLFILIFIAGSIISVGHAAATECYLHSAAVGYVCDSESVSEVFVEPQPFADSFLDSITYAKLADYANVYPEPTTAVSPIRNVGDGFLFVTVQAVIENETGTWYMINFNEFVREEELRLVDDSEFTGFEISVQPQRPFGWMVVDYWYSNEPGAEPTDGNLKLPRYTFFEIYDAIEAEDGWIWYDIGNGRWMRQTYVSLVESSPRPEGVAADAQWVEVDLYEQTFAAYEGDRMVYAGLISSGLNRWPTNEGLFQVWSRHTMVEMAGAEGKEDYYLVEDVPHTMFFDNDIALHGAYWHDRFGYKHSHGCVNMAPRSAEWVFNWSADSDTDLWVWAHTSDPYTIFEHFDHEVDFAGP